MKTDPATNLPESSLTLTSVLRQSEDVGTLVQECIRELSAVRTFMAQELDLRTLLPGVESVLEKSNAVTGKLQEAARILATLNRSLESEVRLRTLLDYQFAAAVEQERAARHAALHDVLTGLPNRALFNDRLEHGFAQAKRHDWAMAVMFVDLDDFKKVNDSYGHEVGDSVLRIIAQRLKESTRADDTVSRHGGDEFLFLATEIQDEHSIALIAEKLIKTIREPFDISTRALNVSGSIAASIGIAIFPKDGVTADTLVRSADKAMYQAKERKSGYSFA